MTRRARFIFSFLAAGSWIVLLALALNSVLGATPAWKRKLFSKQTHASFGERGLTSALFPVTDPSAIARPEPVVKSPYANSSPPTIQGPLKVATATTDVEPFGSTVSSIENHDECLVVEICVDRYLWELYQRTPKEDTIKKLERRRVAVKRRGKMVTVARVFTKRVDEDFGWKDPKAAKRAGMSTMDYVIGGMDRGFKLRLFHALHAAEAAGLSPGITSAFRDDYRQSIAAGLKAARNKSYHGGSSHGGYGHGLAADIVSVQGGTRDQRWVYSEKLWKWVDAHGGDFGIGRPYLDRDPPHVAPMDGLEYAAHNRGSKTAGSKLTKVDRAALRADAGHLELTREDSIPQAQTVVPQADSQSASESFEGRWRALAIAPGG